MPQHPSSHDPSHSDSSRQEDSSQVQLTAFVLGELPEAERVEWERRVAESAALRADAQAIREAASLVFAALQAEPVPTLTDEQRARILELARSRGRTQSAAATPRVVSVQESASKAAPSRWAILATIGVLTACLLLIVTAANSPNGAQLADGTSPLSRLAATNRPDDAKDLIGADPMHVAEAAPSLPEFDDAAVQLGLTRTAGGDVVIGQFVYFKAMEDRLTDESLALTELSADANMDGVTVRLLSEELRDQVLEESIALRLEEAAPNTQRFRLSEQELDRLSRENARQPVLSISDGEAAGTRLYGLHGADPNGSATVYNYYSNGVPDAGLDHYIAGRQAAPSVSFATPQILFEAEGLVTTSPGSSGQGLPQHYDAYSAQLAGSRARYFDYSGMSNGQNDQSLASPGYIFLETPDYGSIPSQGNGEQLNEWMVTSGGMMGAGGMPGSPAGTGRPLGTGGGFAGGDSRFQSITDFDVEGDGVVTNGETQSYRGFAFRGVVPDQYGEVMSGGRGLPESLDQLESLVTLNESLPAANYLNDDVQFFPAGPETQLPRTRRLHEEYRALQRAESLARSESETLPLAWRRADLSWEDGHWYEGRYNNTESYAPIVENPFKSPMEEPLATLGVDVDTASYSNLRRFIEAGQWPPADAVRIEELLNSFTYDYPQPEEGEPFSVTMEVAACPWQPEHRLMRVGMHARDVDLANRPATSLVFLIDVSGSMSDADKLPLVQESLKLLLEQMTENDRLAIVTYRDNAQVALQSITGDRRAEAIAVIDSLTAEGSTNGEGGLQLAYEVAVTNFIRGGQNRVILCTDGDFNVGESSDDAMVQLIKQKRETGVFLSIFGFGEGNLQDSKLEGIADHGNGQYAYIDGIKQARRKFLDELTGTLYTVAKDVKLQVEFNPLLVRGYRLIGYENRVLAAEDFNNDRVDAGDIGAGHTVTALFEIIPGSAMGEVAPSVDPLRYQRTDEVKTESPAESADPSEDAAENDATIPRFYRLTSLDPDAVADTLESLLGSEVAVDAKDATVLEIDATVENHTQVVDALRQLGEEPQVSVAWQIDHLEQVVVPAEVAHELCVVKVRYKQPTSDESVRREFPVDDRDHPLTAPSRDFHWATAVAGYGMLVRQSPHRGDISWNAVIEIAHGARGEDADGRRAEFVTLAQQTRDLWYKLHGIDNTPQPVSLDSTTARERATCGGKYSNLLDKLEVPNDFSRYGNFHDFGWWDGTEYEGHTGLPPAFWVYVHPHWYLWGNASEDVTTAPSDELPTATPVESLPESQVGSQAPPASGPGDPDAALPAVEAEPIDVFFSGNNVSIETIQGLAGQRIATLTLMDARFDGAIIEGLRHTASIDSLRLYGDGLSGQIPRLAHITGLTSLELGTPLRLLDLEAIGALGNLRRLKLPGELAITVTGARNIAKLRGLTSLDLYNCQLDDASFSELYPLQQLTELDVSLTQVSDVGLPTLTYFPHLKSLRLDRNWMTQTRITDSIAPTLASLTELETLSLWGTHIGNDGLSQIAALPNLTSLSIGQSEITGEGLAALETSTVENLTLSPSQIGTLSVGDRLLNELTPQVLQQLHQRELEEHFPASEVPAQESPSDSSQPGESPPECGQAIPLTINCDDLAGEQSSASETGEQNYVQEDAGPASESPGDSAAAVIDVQQLETQLAAHMPGLMHIRQMSRLKSVLVIGQFDPEWSAAVWMHLAPHLSWGFIDP